MNSSIKKKFFTFVPIIPLLVYNCIIVHNNPLWPFLFLRCVIITPLSLLILFIWVFPFFLRLVKSLVIFFTISKSNSSFRWFSLLFYSLYFIYFRYVLLSANLGLVCYSLSSSLRLLDCLLEIFFLIQAFIAVNFIFSTDFAVSRKFCYIMFTFSFVSWCF